MSGTHFIFKKINHNNIYYFYSCQREKKNLFLFAYGTKWDGSVGPDVGLHC